MSKGTGGSSPSCGVIKKQKENNPMDKDFQLKTLKNRLNRLEQNGKNVKSPGVVRRLKRQIRNLEK